jgi:hypothetical protein
MRIHVQPAVDAGEVIRLWDEGLSAKRIAERLDVRYLQVLRPPPGLNDGGRK